MTKEQSEDNLEREKDNMGDCCNWFGTATATKIATARGQAMVKGMGVYRLSKTNNGGGRDRGNDGAIDGASLGLNVLWVLLKLKVLQRE